MITLKETLISNPTDTQIHPIGGRIWLPTPDICRLLYNGNDVRIHVADRRDLTPLVVGVMAMNAIAAKSMGVPYPPSLIDPVLWRPEHIGVTKQLLYSVPNGIEASLSSLEPSNFVYLRASNYPAEHPCITVIFDQALPESTRPSVVTR